MLYVELRGHYRVPMHREPSRLYPAGFKRSCGRAVLRDDAAGVDAGFGAMDGAGDDGGLAGVAAPEREALERFLRMWWCTLSLPK